MHRIHRVHTPTTILIGARLCMAIFAEDDAGSRAARAEAAAWFLAILALALTLDIGVSLAVAVAVDGGAMGVVTIVVAFAVYASGVMGVPLPRVVPGREIVRGEVTVVRSPGRSVSALRRAGARAVSR